MSDEAKPKNIIESNFRLKGRIYISRSIGTEEVTTVLEA